MSIVRFAGACGLLIFCGAHGFALKAQYTFQPVEYGGDPKKIGTVLTGINNKGTVAGYITFDQGHKQCWEGILGYPGGQFSAPINEPEALPCSTFGTGLNDSGEVVGYYYDAGDVNIHGFLDIGGSFTTVDVLSGPSTVIRAINDAGDYAGISGYYPSGPGSFHGFTSINGVVTQVDVPGWISTEIQSIDGAGAVAGCGVYQSVPRAFIHEPGGAFFGFTIAHAAEICATGIRSELGLVAGFFNDGKRLLGFVLDYRGSGSQPDPLTGVVKVTPILYPGSSQTQVWGMNTLGQLSGWAYLDGKNIGFIATPTAAPTN